MGREAEREVGRRRAGRARGPPWPAPAARCPWLAGGCLWPAGARCCCPGAGRQWPGSGPLPPGAHPWDGRKSERADNVLRVLVSPQCLPLISGHMMMAAEHGEPQVPASAVLKGARKRAAEDRKKKADVTTGNIVVPRCTQVAQLLIALCFLYSTTNDHIFLPKLKGPSTNPASDSYRLYEFIKPSPAVWACQHHRSPLLCSAVSRWSKCM